MSTNNRIWEIAYYQQDKDAERIFLTFAHRARQSCDVKRWVYAEKNYRKNRKFLFKMHFFHIFSENLSCVCLFSFAEVSWVWLICLHLDRNWEFRRSEGPQVPTNDDRRKTHALSSLSQFRKNLDWNHFKIFSKIEVKMWKNKPTKICC